MLLGSRHTSDGCVPAGPSCVGFALGSLRSAPAVPTLSDLLVLGLDDSSIVGVAQELSLKPTAYGSTTAAGAEAQQGSHNSRCRSRKPSHSISARAALVAAVSGCLFSCYAVTSPVPSVVKYFKNIVLPTRKS